MEVHVIRGATPLKLEERDFIGRKGAGTKKKRQREKVRSETCKQNDRESGNAAGRDLARPVKNALLAKMVGNAINDLVQRSLRAEAG